MPEVRVTRVLDAEYPSVLRELENPPDPFCVRGELPDAPGVAIVGTREASPNAECYARALAFRLARRGVAVWSGGAVGIDAAAHRGALDAGGRTVVVVGTGLKFCYPPEHESLYERIVASGGALISPFDAKQPATQWTFLRRNSVLAALTDAMVVVQAPIHSGARSAAATARRLGRRLFVVPASPWEPNFEGNLAEIELGAAVLTSDEQLLQPTAPSRRRRASHPPPRRPVPPSPEPEPEPQPDWSAACRALFLATDLTPRHIDDLCGRTGLLPALLQEALLTLTLQAVLVEGPCGCYCRLSARNR